MSKYEGKLLPRAIAGGVAMLCAHIAFAAGPAKEHVQQLAPSFQSETLVQTPAVATTTSNDVLTNATPTPVPASGIDPHQIECVAKVIRHEAANQPIDGQIAVAQVIRARMKDGRFPTTACGVAKQRGQFFDVDAYDPPRTDARWALAMRIATDTLEGEGDEVASGALFFHSAGIGMPGRVRVTKIADHTFYR